MFDFLVKHNQTKMDVDLNLENYTFDDLLHLFHLTPTFTLSDLKQAHKQVYKAHPDKSGLSKEYFIFLNNAIKLLYDVHEIIQRRDECPYKTRNTEYRTDDGSKKELVHRVLRKFKKPQEFHVWFNEQFEEIMGDTKERISRDDGYDEWMKTDDNYQVGDTHGMSKEEKWRHVKQQAKRRMDELVVYQEPVALQEDRVQPASSSLQYEDLKRAHTECVIPVFEEDVKHHKEYTMSYQQYNDHRQTQNLRPLEKEQALQILREKRDKEQTMSSYEAYNMLKRQEELEKKQGMFWGRIQQLTQ